MRKGGIGIILHPPIVSARLSPPSLGAFQSPFADLLSSLTLLLIWHAPILFDTPQISAVLPVDKLLKQPYFLCEVKFESVFGIVGGDAVVSHPFI